ncbi:MAG: DinB family protein [Phycisphaerales bacterium]|nr:DinB family protein [Phycisphaerales bacterium]MCB9864573.1 DinB family protein [Phycisphaerales bacterium]
MDVKRALKGQYHAALDMLKRAIELCPDDAWTDDASTLPFWQVAYHTLYFTHLYLNQTEGDFVPWEHHKPDYHDLPWPADSGTTPEHPYDKSQLLAYWRICDEFVDTAVDRLDLDATDSGFSWHKGFPKLDHQLQNLRHIQHHTAILSARLRANAGDAADIAWVRFRHIQS